MKAVKRAIIICWAMLIVCFIIKLFGGNWFEIMCNDEHFIYVCNFIDNHMFIQDMLAGCLYLLSSYYIIKACSLLPNPSIKQIIIIVACLLIVWEFKYISVIAKSIAEAINHLILPIVINLIGCKGKEEKIKKIKSCWYYGIIGYAAIVVFQIISLITKNFGIGFINDTNTLVSVILMIDYYIMIALYYLYVKLKRGYKENG